MLGLSHCLQGLWDLLLENNGNRVAATVSGETLRTQKTNLKPRTCLKVRSNQSNMTLKPEGSKALWDTFRRLLLEDKRHPVPIKICSASATGTQVIVQRPWLWKCKATATVPIPNLEITYQAVFTCHRHIGPNI